MIAVPEYLLPYAHRTKIVKEAVSFDLECTCGCSDFALLKNSFTAEEERVLKEYEQSFPNTGWHTVYSEKGEDEKPRFYIKRLFFFKQYLVFPQAPVFADIKVIKAICKSCGKEILIFDSRLHGYDSIESSDEKKAYIPHFNENKAQDGNVSVKIEQNDEADVDSALFSNICVYLSSHDRKRLCFEWETA